VAFKVEVWSLETAVVLTVKVAVVAVAATETEDGEVRVVLLLAMLTLAPLMGAAFESVTVQVDWAAGPKEAGEHESALTAGKEGVWPLVTLPPVVKMAIESPASDAATPLEIPTAVPDTPAAMVKFKVATTPLATVVEFRP
jgi:hypothetical protein